jgi:hypothetical protein
MNDTQYNELLTIHPRPWTVKQKGFEVNVIDKNDVYVACMTFNTHTKANLFQILLEISMENM